MTNAPLARVSQHVVGLSGPGHRWRAFCASRGLQHQEVPAWPPCLGPCAVGYTDLITNVLSGRWFKLSPVICVHVFRCSEKVFQQLGYLSSGEHLPVSDAGELLQPNKYD